MGRAMLSISLIKFSVDGWSCVPSLLFTWEKIYGGGNKDNLDLPQKNPVMYCHSLCPQPCSRPPPTHAFAGDFWTPTGKSPVWSLFLSPESWCQRFCCALQESISQSYVSSGSSMVGLMVTSSKRTYAILTTQSPCPCSRPPLTHISTGDTQTQFGLSFCGVPVSWCTQGLFEPSEDLWRLWGLIINVISPLLPSCWGFFFAPGHGLSSQSHSITTQLLLQRRAAAAPAPAILLELLTSGPHQMW